MESANTRYHKECETEDGYGICPSCVHYTRRKTCEGCRLNDSFSAVIGDMPDCSKDTSLCLQCEFGFECEEESEV